MGCDQMSYYRLDEQNRLILSDSGKNILNFLGISLTDLKKISSYDLINICKKAGEPLKGNTYRQGGNGSYSGYDNKTNNSTFAFGEEGVNRNRVIADKSNNPNRFYSLDAWWEKRNITLTGESAFFDVPKPSKAEKNKGLEDYYILKKDIPKHIKEELNNILNNKTL